MEKIKIIVDSCADLTQELLEKFDIDYARMNTCVDGKETPASLIWEYYSVHDFYESMRNGTRVTTTQVPQEEFRRVFTSYLEKGYDTIIYIACSSRLSGSVNTGFVVANEILSDYKDRKILCIDACNSSIGQGAIAMHAAELVKEGKSSDEIYDEVISLRKYGNQFATVATLDFLRKSGRVKASSAFFGNLFGIKPIIISDVNGSNVAIKKVKGRKNSFKEMVTSLKETINEDSKIYVSHADCSQEELNLLYDLLKEEIPGREIITVPIGPIVGASTGPDTIMVYGFGKEVTYNGDLTN